MSKFWRYVALACSILTLIALSPYLIGLIGVTVNLQSADVSTLERVVYLFVGMILALVPLSIGGVILQVLSEVAHGRS